MKAIYDPNAPKRPVNLSLNEALVAQARQMTGNLSAEVESMLADFVQRQKPVRVAEARRLTRAATAWNRFAEKQGSFADEFSTL